jgi:hypothetical protein
MKRDLNVKGRVYYQNLRAKFLASAKDAALSGDRILSEYNLQIAEHYARVIAERFGTNREVRPTPDHVRQSNPSPKIDEKNRTQNQEVPLEFSITQLPQMPTNAQTTTVEEAPIKPTRKRRLLPKLTEENVEQEPIAVVKKRTSRKKVNKEQI